MQKTLKNAIWMASAALFLMSAYPSVAQTIVRPTLNAEQCQPLSADNADLCCIAVNRQKLLTDQELNQCPPVTTARIEAVMQALEAGNSGIPTDATVPTDSVPTGGTVPTDSVPTGGTVATDGTAPTDGTGQPGEVPDGTEANANSGAGNGGETGPGETGPADADPGNSGGNNNAPDSPSGQN